MSNTQKCKSNELRVGDKLSTTVYYTVTEVQNGRVKVIDETGSTLTISNAIIERESFTAEQFDEEVKVSRTELVKSSSKRGRYDLQSGLQKEKNGERRELIGRRVPGSDDTCFGHARRRSSACRAQNLKSGRSTTARLRRSPFVTKK